MKRNVAPCCGEERVHVDAVEQVRGLLPPDEELYDLAELFKIFGDSTRVKILYALLEGELCVCDLSALLDLSQSAISHQLRVLRSAKLVKGTKEGKEVRYSLDDDHVTKIMEYGLTHVNEDR